MRKAIICVVLACTVNACTRVSSVKPEVSTTSDPLDALHDSVARGDYQSLSSERSRAATAYYDRLLRSATKLVNCSHDPEGQALLDFMRGRSVLEPLTSSVSGVGLARRGATDMPVILIGYGDYTSPDGFWGEMLAGADASKAQSTAGRFWSGLNVFLFPSDQEPDRWTASVLLHEARHAIDTRDFGPDYITNKRWVGERRAFDLQTRLVRAWGGAAYKKWAVRIERERAAKGWDLTGVDDGPTPDIKEIELWEKELDTIFGPVASSSADSRLSFVFMELNFRHKNEAGREKIIAAIYGAMGY